MHTKDILAAALRDVGLNDMADKAAEGYYHDFLSPLATPEIQLVNDLGVAAVGCPDDARRLKILALRADVIDGIHDANAEESEEWARSPEGQEAFGKLTRGE